MLIQNLEVKALRDVTDLKNAELKNGDYIMICSQ